MPHEFWLNTERDEIFRTEDDKLLIFPAPFTSGDALLSALNAFLRSPSS